MPEPLKTLADLAAEECAGCGRKVGTGWVAILHGESADWYCTQDVACRHALRAAMGREPGCSEMLARIAELESQLEDANDELEFLRPRATEH